MDSAPPPVVVASFRSPAEAEAAARAMTDAGIESRQVRDGVIGISLIVGANDADRAIELLAEMWPEPPQPHSNERPVIDIERCPECRSQDLLRIRRLPFFIIVSTAMVAIGYAVGQPDLFALMVAIVAGILFLGPNRRCMNCGALWRAWASGLTPRPAEPDLAVEPPDVLCPRCGSPDTGRIFRRRQKAWTLLVHFVLPPLLLLWPFQTKRKCEECGHEFR